MKEFVWKRDVNYFWERTLVYCAKPFVMRLVDSPITPNMITIFNIIINLPLIGLCCYLKNCYLLALVIQLYALLDVMDGNLARNKHMASDLGKKLDVMADTVFYILGYILIGFAVDASWAEIAFLILCQQIYGCIATYYIVPNLRKNKNFRHTKLKAFFEGKGILFGMDATLQCIITTIMLLTPLRKELFVVCGILWIVDILYRLYELLIFNRKEE